MAHHLNGFSLIAVPKQNRNGIFFWILDDSFFLSTNLKIWWVFCHSVGNTICSGCCFSLSITQVFALKIWPFLFCIPSLLADDTISFFTWPNVQFRVLATLNFWSWSWHFECCQKNRARKRSVASCCSYVILRCDGEGEVISSYISEVRWNEILFT